MSNEWIILLAYSSEAVTLDIQGQRYEYSAAENDIDKFRRLFRWNKGRALVYLKEKAFRCYS